MTAQLKFADGTVVLGSITNNDETAYLQEVEGLASWCQTNCLPLNVSKTKASGGLQERTPLNISGYGHFFQMVLNI